MALTAIHKNLPMRWEGDLSIHGLRSGNIEDDEKRLRVEDLVGMVPGLSDGQGRGILEESQKLVGKA